MYSLCDTANMDVMSMSGQPIKFEKRTIITKKQNKNKNKNNLLILKYDNIENQNYKIDK